MADISIEALHIVKSALSVFQTDIEGLSIRSLSCANTITNNCTTQIKQTKLEISQVEQTISELERRIDSLENTIIRATDEYHNLIARIPKIQNAIQSLNLQISYLNSQIASLYSQLCDTDDDDICQQLGDQIAALEEQIQQCEYQCSEFEGELQDAEERKTDLQQQICSAKSEKAECEEQRDTQKNRYNKMRNKLERLRSAFSRVENDLNIYVAATKKFESNSLNSVQNNTNAVIKCLDSINQYLAINLGSQNSGSSLSHGFASNSSGPNNSHTGSPEQQLRDYMYSHNYGIDDYNTYSQDPEWQELHSQVYPDFHRLSTADSLPDSDIHFCGLPIQHLPNGTWGVVSSCQSSYEEYSNHFDDYAVENYPSCEFRTVDARRIAGIDMISDRDLANPEIFWGRSGGTFESFMEIAQLIPSIQQQLDNGIGLEAIMSDEHLGECARLFFNVNSLDHPTVYENDGFYELSGGGRHRVMLAQLLGYSIPVRVRGRIFHR